MTRRVASVAAALALVATACAAPTGEPGRDVATTTTAPATTPTTVPAEPGTDADGFELPDITSRRITADDIGASLPRGADDLTTRGNEDLLTEAVLDREDEAADILTFGRITGVGAMYAGPPETHVWLDLLPDADAAHDYLQDAAGDIAKGIGGTHAPGVGATSTQGFPVEVGHQSIGMTAQLADGRTETLILSRAGRVVLFTSQVHDPQADARVAVQYVMEDLLQSLVAVLTESDLDPTAATSPRYRFETIATVEVGDETTTITTEGIVDGRDRRCTIEVQGEGGDRLDEVVEADGTVWWRSGARTFQRVGGGNLEVAGLLAQCPAWPLGARAAGLQPLMDQQPEPARHHVNGVDALGYQSDEEGLATVLGRPSIVSTVAGFSFWVAETGGWVVELAISLEGPADERALLLGSLDPGGGDGTLTIRHRVFEIGTLEQSVVPPE